LLGDPSQNIRLFVGSGFHDIGFFVYQSVKFVHNLIDLTSNPHDRERIRCELTL